MQKNIPADFSFKTGSVDSVLMNNPIEFPPLVNKSN